MHRTRLIFGLVVILAVLGLGCGEEQECPKCTTPADVDVPSDRESDQLGDATDGTPRIIVQPTLDFGMVLLGMTVERSLMVYSAGTAPLRLLSINLNSTTDEFSIVDAPEDGTELLPDEQAEIVIQYQPTDPGADSATLDIYSNDPETPLVHVQIVSGYKGRSHLVLVPPQEAPVAHINSEEVEIIIVLTNQPQNLDDNKVITVSDISLEQSEHFSLDRTSFSLPLFISPHQEYRLRVLFHPKALGEQSARLSISSDADENPNPSETVLGIGAVRQLDVLPSTVDLGSVPVGDSGSASVELSVAEGIERLPITITEVRLEGDTDVFSLSAIETPLTLEAGSNTTLEVSYTPSEVEGNTATLVIESNDFYEPVKRIPVSGTGARRALRVGTGFIDFGEVCAGSSAQVSVLIEDDGGLGGVVTAATITPEGLGFSIPEDALPLEVPAGGSAELPISFIPVQVGEVQATLRFESNSLDPLGEVVLQAVGTSAEFAVEPSESPVELGVVHALDSATTTISVSNPGACPLVIAAVSLSEGSDPRFKIEGLPEQFPVELAPNSDDELSFQVVFDPQGGVGEGFAAVAFDTNLGEQTVSLHADAVYPRLDVSPPDGVEFGQWHAGADSDPVQITIRNAGVGTLILDSVELTGDDVSAFEISGLPERFPVELDTAEELVLTAVLHTSAERQYSAVLRIVSNDRSAPTLDYELSGAGVPCPENYYDCDDDPRVCEYFCIPSGDEVCDGADNDCDCAIDEDFPEVGTPCLADGVCGLGTWECNPNDRTQTVCSTAPGGSEDQSSAELCDGLDNDCDGQTDEDFVYGNGLHIGDACDGKGICGQGVVVCAPDKQHAICSTEPGGPDYDPQDPAHEEVCDGLDNDCDGQTDEGFNLGEACTGVGVCGFGSVECAGPHTTRCSTMPGGSEDESSSELCDGLDNDCDGEIDEDFNVGLPCDGQGTCGEGVIECKDLYHTVCSTEIGGSQYDPNDPARLELCDGLDNDCDGEIDENFHVGESCDGVGECGPGTIECADIFTARCSTDPGGSEYNGPNGGKQEICDGKDNDCDGLVDEDFGIGLPCSGVGRCGNGVWECNGPYARVCSTMPGGSNYQGQPEVCNNIDDDCNGIIDDGYHTDPNDPEFFCMALGDCGWGHMECASLYESRCSTEPGGSQYNGFPEVCDGHDNDCDGYVDEGFDIGEACDGIGECGIGHWECVPGAGTRRCSTEPGGSEAGGEDGPKPESIFGMDGLDNDCNGIPDDPWMNTVFRHAYSSGSDKDHVLTTSETPPSDFTSEGAVFSVYSSQLAGTVQIRVFYDAVTTDHVYTVDESTANSLLALGWSELSPLGWARTSAGYQTVPVYELVDTTATDHIYTASEAEKDSLVAQGYSLQGVAFYAWIAQ